MKAVLFTAVAALLAVGAAQAETVKVKTRTGVLAGETSGGVNVFKGVPYAAPPIGALRWAPPQPTVWVGERKATEFALPCLQPTNADGRPNGAGVVGASKEDCLYLNVWPLRRRAKRRSCCGSMAAAGPWAAATSRPTTVRPSPARA